ncbi:type IV secretion system protein [Pseudorhodoferax sp.]|uniref:type IV secretion system protein n=1 Tax=Pseudorhodoferax sp. TaxID=1993553 RepID=UPI0039E2F5BC
MTMGCTGLPLDGPEGIAQALRAVDCLSRQATAGAFGRLFGPQGALSQALTVLLAIYVALLGLGLLSGRTRLRLSLLAPRALTVGLVLTFATSWLAYQQVVVNLAMDVPDELARVLAGEPGSAVDRYARRLDDLLAGVEQAAEANAATGGAAAGRAGPVTPAGVLGLAAFLLMLGTAGLHVAARITLAALLALGPVFIVLALFRATRGLFEGWLKSTLLFALAPLLGVLAGSGALRLVTPMVQAIGNAGSAVTLRQAAGLLLVACVHLALMAIALRAAASLTHGWSLAPAAGLPADGPVPPAVPAALPAATQAPLPAALALHAAARAGAASPAPPAAAQDERIRQLVAAGTAVRPGPAQGPGPAGPWPRTGPAAAPSGARQRIHGLARLRPAAPQPPEVSP